MKECVGSGVDFLSEKGVNGGGMANCKEPMVVMDGLNWVDRAGKCIETGVTG